MVKCSQRIYAMDVPLAWLNNMKIINFANITRSTSFIPLAMLAKKNIC